MSHLRVSFLKQIILFLLCIQGFHKVSESFNLYDEIVMVMTLDIEDSEPEEKFEIKELHKITNPIQKTSILNQEKRTNGFVHYLRFYKENILDFQNPPPERLI